MLAVVIILQTVWYVSKFAASEFCYICGNVPRDKNLGESRGDEDLDVKNIPQV